MILQQVTHQHHVIPNHLGALLKMLRDRHGVKQSDVYLHLPGWSQTAYSRIENDQRAPGFDQLPAIYKALKVAGIQLTIQDRELFLFLAQKKISAMQRRHARQSGEAWNALYAKLAAIDGLSTPRGIASSSFSRLTQQKSSGEASRREVGHLLGRESWLASVLDMLLRPSPVKVLVLQGSPGSGKTSELHRLMYRVVQDVPRSTVVLSEPPPIQLERLEATDVLERLLGDMLEMVGVSATMPMGHVQARINYVLGSLTKIEHPVVIGLDNAEHIFDVHGQLETTWRRFLTQFAQADHRATLLLASQEWPTSTFLAESQLIATIDVPLLSQREGTQLLQSLGLRSVSEELLDRAVERTGGLPVCLEWVVRLIREPFLRDEWSEFEESDESTVLARLLDDPAIFGGAVAQRVQPLLDRVLNRLTDEAATALRDLAVAPVPLGLSALKVLYQSPRALRELREASLLVAHPQRAQLLPMVAAQIRVQLSPHQQQQSEERLIEALFLWMTTGKSSLREQGEIVTELALLLLKHRRLLEAAQFIIRYGWLGFKLGHAQRIARFALQCIEAVCQQAPQEQLDVEQQCAIKLLYYFLAPFLGYKIDAAARVKDYQFICEALMHGSIVLQPHTEVYLVRNLIAYTISKPSKERFEEAQQILACCQERMIPFVSDPDLKAALLEVHALLLTRWSDFAEEQGEVHQATEYRLQAIQLYREGCNLLAEHGPIPALFAHAWKKRLAKLSTNLGYQLDLVGRYEEALPILEQSILLKEEGFVEPGSLANSYGEKSQALAALGRFEEALHYDALAVEDIERLARAGDTVSQEERWIYLVNRACLYLQLQRVDDAEILLRDAIPHIALTRGKFSMLAEQILKEIEAWRENTASGRYQRDWRWIGRLREIISFNAFWWLAHAGPFSPDEQQEWQALEAQPASEDVQRRREAIVSQSRQRELALALAEKREPSFCYPAIPLGEVQSRIEQLRQLDADLSHEEANEAIRSLYQARIEEEVHFLHLIEATHQRDRQRFWECNQYLHPVPSPEEMHYALSRVKSLVWQGAQREESRAASEHVLALLREQLQVSCEFSTEDSVFQNEQKVLPLSPAQGQRFVSAKAARQFFEAILAEGECEGWRVILDANAASTRVEAASRLLILPERRFSLEECKALLEHEVLSHIADAVAGERSPLGLLAVGSRNYMPISEGLALYHEMQAAKVSGKAFDDSKIWLGALSAGLAGGVCTSPQSFFSLYSFLRAFLILYRLLRRPDESLEMREKSADSLAQTLCLRTFRGVPHLELPGVCYSKDVCYLRGVLLVEAAVAEDETILGRLSVGRIALEYLPIIERLGIKPSLQPIRKRVSDGNLDAYILSFEARAEAVPDDSEANRSTT